MTPGSIRSAFRLEPLIHARAAGDLNMNMYCPGTRVGLSRFSSFADTEVSEQLRRDPGTGRMTAGGGTWDRYIEGEGRSISVTLSIPLLQVPAPWMTRVSPATLALNSAASQAEPGPVFKYSNEYQWLSLP